MLYFQTTAGVFKKKPPVQQLKGGMWMEENPAVSDALQWHPTFFTVLQIELEDDKENLIFENEHQLSKKPMGIDVLVIKKEKDIPVQKNIGHLFKAINIIEYN